MPQPPRGAARAPGRRAAPRTRRATGSSSRRRGLGRASSPKAVDPVSHGRSPVSSSAARPRRARETRARAAGSAMPSASATSGYGRSSTIRRRSALARLVRQRVEQLGDAGAQRLQAARAPRRARTRRRSGAGGSRPRRAERLALDRRPGGTSRRAGGGRSRTATPRGVVAAELRGGRRPRRRTSRPSARSRPAGRTCGARRTPPAGGRGRRRGGRCRRRRAALGSAIGARAAKLVTDGQKRSAGILLFRRDAGARGAARASGRAVLGQEGPRGVVDPEGRARRGRGRRRRARSASSPRRPGSEPMPGRARRPRRRSSRRRARSCRRGRSRAISTRRPSDRTRFRCNGRRARAGCRSSRRSTAPSGSALDEARQRINPAQAAFLDRLVSRFDS